jgi:hypothetical protein
MGWHLVGSFRNETPNESYPLLVDRSAFGSGASGRRRNQKLQQWRRQELLILVIEEFEFRQQPQFRQQFDSKFEQQPQQEFWNSQHSQFELWQ